MKAKTRFTALAVLALTALVFVGCNSPEFTSAKMYVQQSNLPKAEEFFLKAMDVEPTNPEIPFLLASEVYQKQEKYELVKKYLDESLKRGPMYKEQIENLYKYNWGTNFNKGVEYFNAVLRGEATDRDMAVEKAIKHFSVAKLFKPEDENTIFQLARTYNDLAEDPAMAQTVLDEGIDLIPSAALLAGLKSEYLLDAGRTDEAKATLIASLEEKPDELKNIQRLGAIYFEEENFEEAIALYQRAIAEFPSEKDLYFNLGILYVKMDDLDNANPMFQQVLAFDPSDLEVIEAVGDVYMNQQDYISAEGYYRQLYDSDPMNTYYMRKLANALNGQKRYEEGLDLIRQAKALE